MLPSRLRACEGAIYQMGPRGIYHRLGLSAPITTGDRTRLFRFAADVDWRSLTRISKLLPVPFLIVFSPLVEEIEFRGFGVWQLQRVTREPLEMFGFVLPLAVGGPFRRWPQPLAS